MSPLFPPLPLSAEESGGSSVEEDDFGGPSAEAEDFGGSFVEEEDGKGRSDHAAEKWVAQPGASPWALVEAQEPAIAVAPGHAWIDQLRIALGVLTAEKQTSNWCRPPTWKAQGENSSGVHLGRWVAVLVLVGTGTHLRLE